MDDVDLDLVGRELEQRVAERFDGAVHVAFDDDVELLEVADGATPAYVVECEYLLGAHAQFALQLLALGGDLAGLLLGLHHVEGVAGGGGAVKAEYQRRSGRPCLGDALVAFVEHGLDLAVVGAGEDYVADMEGAVLHEHGGHIAAALVERRLDDRPYGLAVGIGAEFEHLGFEQHLLHEFLELRGPFWPICPATGICRPIPRRGSSWPRAPP